MRGIQRAEELLGHEFDVLVARHIVSVCRAHPVTLRLFSGIRAAVISQFPPLLFRVLSTTAGV